MVDADASDEVASIGTGRNASGTEAGVRMVIRTDAVGAVDGRIASKVVDVACG